MKNIYRIGFLAVMVAFAGCFAAVNGQTVTGSITGGTVTRGSSSKATVYLSVPGGLHVNSNRPKSEYQIPTTVRASAKGAKVSSIIYPRGHDRKFEFSQDTINVYEGRTAFRFNVSVPSTFRGDTVRVNVSVKYQACTNEVCYPPKTKNITLTARVK